MPAAAADGRAGNQTPQPRRSPRRGDRILPASAGVALADILANGVAIVIIMIVLTSMARYEQEQDKLQRTEDVAVLLSRELATSVVMNALPTSPPARLHDYVASSLDRNPHPSKMPILELHDGFVRDYYTGTIYRREALLEPANALDAYLAALAPEQRAATRVDVYGIREFYLAMSIFKAHGLAPRHWHFLGDRDGPAPGTGGAWAAAPPAPSLAQEETPRSGRGGLGSIAGNPEGGERHGAEGPALPEDVAIAGASPNPTAYPVDGAVGVRGAANAQPLPGLDGAEPPWTTQPSATPGNTAPLPTPAGRRFRAAVPTAPTTLTLLNQPTSNLTATLRALFAFMEAEQAAADANLPSRLPVFDFQRHVLALVPTLPPPTPAEASLVRSLVFLIDRPRQPESRALPLRPTRESTVRGQAIALFSNEPLSGGRWLHGPEQGTLPPETTATVTLQLGSHAAIHEGRRMPLSRDAIVLVPPSTAAADPQPRWRVVTLVNPARNDFVTGFVFAGEDANGRLALLADENAIELDGLRVESRYPADAWRDEIRQLLLYGVLALLLAAGIVFGWRRVRRPGAGRRTVPQPA